jgi:hypothetical protein
MATIKATARRAGLLYLLIALTAPIGLLYVPSRLIVVADAAATAAHLRTDGWLLRLGIASELFHQTIGIFLALVLYRLFKSVNERRAMLLVVLVLVPVPIVFLNVLNEVAALIVVSGSGGMLPAFAPRQIDALALFFLRLHGQGIVIASVFWGLWLFPFGMLVIRSGFIPRVLGVLLLLAGAAYLASAFTTLVLPAYGHAVGQVALLLEMGELPIILWLAIRGATRDGPTDPTASTCVEFSTRNSPPA